MSLTPIALPSALPSELLTYILAHQAYPTTLIICQPRAAFLSSLLSTIRHASPPTSSPPPPPNNTADSPIFESQPQRHLLLIPTLHQVATSRDINLVFIPTVSHLRAYLSVFPPPEKGGKELLEHVLEKPEVNTPLLVLYGVVELHRDTSEWSAQGFGNSLAGVVEAGLRAGRRVVVLEERSADGEPVGEQDLSEGRTRPLCKIWEERVPMLNGSVRRAGLESEEGGWSGRTVEIGRILARWFKFREGDWDTGDRA